MNKQHLYPTFSKDWRFTARSRILVRVIGLSREFREKDAITTNHFYYHCLLGETDLSPAFRPTSSFGNAGLVWDFSSLLKVFFTNLKNRFVRI